MPEKSHSDAIESDCYPFDIKILEVFLPYISVFERERLSQSSGQREDKGSPEVGVTRALSGEPDRLGETVVSGLIHGAIPLNYIVDLARRCGFRGLPLIEYAALHSGEARCLAEPETAGFEVSVGSVFERLFDVLGEERPGQLEMAQAVMSALQDDGVALIEAGTGTGKSLAYLVPSILHLLETGERVLISTYTRNLQDQLFRKELPLLKSILGV
ncbi:MAG: DEAD/DEAH box helicase, partial [Candidatus Krumholzibacteria bacterium]|nr:DEAD/DEAH box helicase [Candidatus Krumholzibacteria bacterium]